MIELKNVNKCFDDNVIFNQLSYQFLNGKTYALICASGSGKTTLLNIIGKLETATKGEVIVEGTPLKKIKEKDYFKNYIGYLFQNYGLIENKSIKENLDLAFIGQKLIKTSKIEKMKEALRQVNLTLDLSRKIFTLSGGESQRVAIAKIILKDSPIILADEPTASLDETNSQEIMELILKLQTKEKIIIISTHNPNVYQMLDEIINVEEYKGE
nr:ATP-binding cassette domain-containing protein [Melissococcus plutonius]